MKEDVNRYIDMKLNVLYDYFTVPESAQAEVDAVTAQIYELGGECADAAEFDARFNSSPLNQRYNMLFMKCTPKPRRKMTKEQKQYSRETFKEILKEDNGGILKDAVTDRADLAASFIADDAASHVISELQSRPASEKVMRETWQAANTIENFTHFFKFIKNKRDEKKQRKQAAGRSDEPPAGNSDDRS